MASDTPPSTASLPRDLTQAVIIFVMGGPSSGKSTHCVRLASDLNLIHIGIDPMLRRLERTGPAGAWNVVKSAMEEGKLAPIGLIMSLLKEEMSQHVERGHYTFLLDGFPRSMEQYLDFCLTFSFSFAIYVKASLITEYHRFVNPRLPRSPAHLEQIESEFQRRRIQFEEENLQIIHFLDQQDKVVTVDGEAPLELSYHQLKEIVEVWLYRPTSASQCVYA